MTSFFPDVNVWLALSVAAHPHAESAWIWLRNLGPGAKLVFSRQTQLGLLRLLTNETIMGGQRLTLGKAWAVYDEWLADSRVGFHPEPRDLEPVFREATRPFAGKPSSKAVGDCFFLAHAESAGATLVTFDRGLIDLAKKRGHRAIMPG